MSNVCCLLLFGLRCLELAELTTKTKTQIMNAGRICRERRVRPPSYVQSLQYERI